MKPRFFAIMVVSLAVTTVSSLSFANKKIKKNKPIAQTSRNLSLGIHTGIQGPAAFGGVLSGLLYSRNNHLIIKAQFANLDRRGSGDTGFVEVLKTSQYQLGAANRYRFYQHFYFDSGLNYLVIKGDYGLSQAATNSSTLTQFSSQAITLDLSIGNSYFLKPNLELGCSWAGLTPFLSLTSHVSDNLLLSNLFNASSGQSVKDNLHSILKKINQYYLFNLYLAYRF